MNTVSFIRPRISLSNLQTQAFVSLLCTIGTYNSIDISQNNEYVGPFDVTVWRNGEPTTWTIEPDGTTRES